MLHITENDPEGKTSEYENEATLSTSSTSEDGETTSDDAETTSDDDSTTEDDGFLTEGTSPEYQDFFRDYFVQGLHSMVLVEMVEQGYNPEDFWEKLGLTTVWTVAHRRFIPDPHRKSHMRALILFTTSEHAKAAVAKWASEEGINFCAVIVHDLISSIAKVERALRDLDSEFDSSESICVSRISSEEKASDVRQYLELYFSAVGEVKEITFDTGNSRGEAVLKYHSLSEAFLAELAFDNMLIEGTRLHVEMSNDIVATLQALANRLEEQLRCNKNSEGSSKIPVCKREFSSGCSNLHCSKCCQGGKIPQS